MPIRTLFDKLRRLGDYCIFGAFVGLLTGAYEAALLRTLHRLHGLDGPDVGPVIWVISPLAHLALFAALGVFVGLLDLVVSRFRTKSAHVLLAILPTLAITYAVSARSILRDPWGIAWTTKELPIKLLIAVATFGVVTFALYRWRTTLTFLFPGSMAFWRKRLAAGVVVTAAFLLGVLALYSATRPGHASWGSEVSAQGKSRPNLVLITLDTTRADHLSCYGYERPTTPNLDRLAKRGVLFGNAISASSWTLEGHESMFTGLLPHQRSTLHAVRMSSDPSTLAELLQSWGYETAGFSSNLYYGLRGWGMERGFELYDDDSSAIRHNLAATLIGAAILQPAYDHWVEHDWLGRRDADEVNRDVLTWLHRRSGKPFFLFINYYDAHNSYHSPPPYDQRFGRRSIQLERALDAPDWEAPSRIPEVERRALIAGYDNSLSFMDEQVGQLLKTIDGLSDCSNTIVIITGDHGESFGEHGTYRHGLNLYREVIHVPLIIYGPGIPAGVRVSAPVPTRKLFGTLLGLASQGRLPVGNNGLRHYWDARPQSGLSEMAVSELITRQPNDGVIISLMTPEWHFLRNAYGKEELYHWPSDPSEQTNLAGSPNAARTQNLLHRLLYNRIRHSVLPWPRRDYLAALNQPGRPFLVELLRPSYAADISSDTSPNIGELPALLNPQRPASYEERELLQSLPYQ